MGTQFKALTFWSMCLLISVVCATQFDVNAESHYNYIIQLDESRQASELQDQINHRLGRPLEIRHRFTRIFPGFTAPMSEAEAKLVSQMSGVQQVVLDEELTLSHFDNPVTSNSKLTALDRRGRSKESDTSSGDPVVDLIEANRIWDGSATNDGGHMGEGTIIGIIGPGLIDTHPVFDASGSDGYVHINPLGEGNYLGNCFSTPQHVCNSKLIGRYNLTNDPAPVAEGLESYSLNLVSQSAGNLLMDDSLASWGVDIVTGVAPHANIIVYRTCPALTCPISAVLQAFEQAIVDGVDVLINPIGSDSQDPWNSIFSPATLALRENGVMLSQTAGNGGPAPGSLSSATSAPWSSVFISSTHARQPPGKFIGKFKGGNPPLPPTLYGGSIGTSVSAPIVYAGNIPNPNSTGESALCLEPYPDSMLEGKIVVCDRGEIARIQKAINVFNSGAVGFVLANVAGGSDSINLDVFAIPGIHLNTNDANILRNWLNTGSGHHATIGSLEATIDFDLADHIASNSGQGPVFDLDYLMPSGAVPNQNVVVASSGPGLFGLASGPAIAPAGGVLALLKSARPEWTDAERLSALMSTGVTTMFESDGVTQTGTFAHGGGRVNLPAAVTAGLILDETIGGFNAANPLTGGLPKDLNLAGLINLNCIETCSWSRTLKATQSGTWNVVATTGSSGIQIDMTPSTFSLAAGETQVLVVTVDRNGVVEGSVDGVVTLQSDNINVSTTALQLHVNVLADNDLDGLSNSQDNCLDVANPAQEDSDNDNYGNACDTDLNNDGITNFLDLDLFRSAFQSTDQNADFNSDGLVNFIDLDVLITRFLTPPGPSGLASQSID